MVGLHSRLRMGTVPRRIAQTLGLVVLGAIVAFAPAPLAAQPAAPIWSFGGYNLQRVNFTPKAGSLTAPHVAWRLNFETTDRKSTRLNSSHIQKSRMPSSA